MKYFVLGIFLLAIVGCAGAPYIDHLAGIPLSSAPHFHHNEVFVEGQDLYVALDPGRYPSKIGDAYSIYVVEHKTHTQWDANPNLIDVTGPSPVETSTLTAGNVSNNKTKVWSNLSLPSMSHVWHKAYDVVFDFGNDGTYDKADDILDRIGILERLGAEETGGFTLVKDPAIAGDFPVSTHEYNAGSFTVKVASKYKEPGDFKTIKLIGKLYYPATSAGIDKPVNTDLLKYPLIIIAHGRHGGASYSYQGYEYLGKHLASRGFVCASIALNELSSGWRIHHRGVTTLKHVTMLLLETTTDPVITNVRPRMNQGRVGLLGHSRGGEAVVAAQEIYSSIKKPGYAIRAVASFSPTDGENWSETSPGGGPYDPVFPYLMIYGTRDKDLDGEAGNTGYRIVDRANRPRHAITIYGGNHNYFNEKWGKDDSPTITRLQQETLAKAFITSFFSNNLLDQQAYVEIFSSYVVSPSVSAVGTTVLYCDQPERLAQFTIDDSQDIPPGEGSNSLGKTNTSSGVSVFDEESLRYQTVPTRNYYTHDTDGLRTGWKSSGTASEPVSITFGMGDMSVWPYDFLNFRVGQRFRSSNNLNQINKPQDLSVTLSDAFNNTSPPVVVSVFTSILYTDNVGIYTKSIMQSVRIPLRVFTANASPLDPLRVTEVKFTFDRTNTGELIFDDIELLGVDISEPDWKEK